MQKCTVGEACFWLITILYVLIPLVAELQPFGNLAGGSIHSRISSIDNSKSRRDSKVFLFKSSRIVSIMKSLDQSRDELNVEV